MTIIQLLKQLNATISMSDGRRVTSMGAVKLNGFPVQRTDVDVDFHVGDVIEVGKHKKFVVQTQHLHEHEST